jgi:hypothetical protein
MFFQYTLNINSHGYLASPGGGTFDHGFCPHPGEFDQNFFEKSNSRGFARGGWSHLELTGTLLVVIDFPYGELVNNHDV